MFLRRPVLEWCLFLSLWCFYGLLINYYNLESYNLQQIGVEAMAQRGHFYLEGSNVPVLQTRGDVFIYNDHTYAAKQPGQFMLGAAVYGVLHYLFGMSYEQNWLLVAALVTFFSSSSMAALTAVLVFRMASTFTAPGRSIAWPLSAALIYGLASTVLPYSGVAHHDIIGTAFLVTAFYLIQDGARQSRLLLAGFCLGYAINATMLVFFMALTVGTYFLMQKRWRDFPWFVAGGMLGIAPLLWYNTMSFGNPFLMANIAGQYRDTYFMWDPANQLSKLYFYIKMLFWYAPVIMISFAGAAAFPTHQRAMALRIVALVLVLCAYLFNIETVGSCMYGPRYLLPAMPFMAVLSVGFSHLRAVHARRVAVAMLLVSGIYACGVNIAGAMRGSLNCSIDVYLPYYYFRDAVYGASPPSYPLLLWLIVPLALSCAAAGYALAQRPKASFPMHHDRSAI